MSSSEYANVTGAETAFKTDFDRVDAYNTELVDLVDRWERLGHALVPYLYCVHEDVLPNGMALYAPTGECVHCVLCELLCIPCPLQQRQEVNDG